MSTRRGEPRGVTTPTYYRTTTLLGRLLKITAIPLLFLSLAIAVRGQSALDGFDPKPNDSMGVVVVQPDGKILIGGNFNQVSPNGGPPVTRGSLVRLNPDGTLDSAFNPNVNLSVSAIALQADGKVLIGGYFTFVNGQPRRHIARLDATTGLPDLFDPHAEDGVFAIKVQTDGKILVGGFFNGTNSIGGRARNFMARLDPETGMADSLNPNPSGPVETIAVQPGGKILAGGNFQNIGGQTRSFIARLDPTTGLADSFNPSANGEVRTIALQVDGKILVGGFFNGPNSIGGQTRNRIARLDATTGLADSFNPDADNVIHSIAVQVDGNILAGGAFTSVGGQPRRSIARLNATTGLADSFDPNPTSDPSVVYAIAVQADGKIFMGGDFTALAPNGGTPVARNYFARLETDGRLDRTLNLNSVGSFIRATVVQPDGKILIGGNFSSVLGVARNRIARLNVDGTLDTAFNPNADSLVYSIALQADGKVLVGGDFFNIGGQPRRALARLDAITGLADAFAPDANGTVNSIAVQADGKILAGGLYFNIGGQPRNYIARLDPTTGLADSFNPSATSTVHTIALQADGKILVGGTFFTIGGQPRNRMARLDPVTGLADSFNPSPNDWVFAIAVQPDGKILVGGFFNGTNSIGGQARNRLARLDPTTGLADSFDPNANGTVYSTAVQADGRILAGGQFNSIGGQTRNCIARLDSTTGLADSFNPNADLQIISVAVLPDGKILAGGSFATIGGQSCSLLARLTNDTAAQQDLIATQTTVTWTRGGSSPQFTRVSFESSTDNVNFTPLGNGTPAGSNWTLTGLSLPVGQNIYIRARGQYRSGGYNGSDSITAPVWNVFLAPPTITSANNTTFTVGTAGTFTVTTAGMPTGASMSINETGALPGGVTFVNNNNGTATLAGTPGAGTAGSYPITITASNGVSPNATQNFTLNVNQPQPPAITSANTTTFTVGIAGTFTVTTTGFPTGTSMSITETGALPAGVTFVNNNDGTAMLAGTPGPNTGRSYPITIIASNGVAPNASQNFTLNVNQPPAITSANNITFTVGVPGTFPVWTTGFPTGPSMAITESGALPNGVTFTNNNNGTATLAGTPGSGTAGIYPLTITANNGVAPNATQSFTLTVITPPPTPSTLGNISTRLRVLSGDNVLIGGMIATGTGGTRVILRAIGPSLTNLGIPGALENPTLDLFQGSTLLMSNDDWQNSSQQAEIAASGFAPSNAAESAIIWTLTPGQGYTAIVRGTNGTTGVGVVEAYDLDHSPTSKLGNISTRGFVDVDDNVMIAGVIVGPGNGTSARILARALGPTLSDLGVPGALADTTLDLVNSSGTVVRSNNNWKDDPLQRSAIEAAGLAPGHDEEAALVETVAPGAYTAVVRGNNRTTGVGLVEVYHLP